MSVTCENSRLLVKLQERVRGRIAVGVCFTIGLALTSNIALVHAQEETSTEYWSEIYRPTPPWPPELGFSYDHASTVAEGWLRGMAAMIHARGNFWLSHAQATVMLEQAKWLKMANEVEKVRSFGIKQELLRQHKIAKRRAREVRSAEGAKKLAERRQELYREVYQLSPNQLGRTTGVITWPEVLREEKFCQYRTQLERLFEHLVSEESSQNRGRRPAINSCVEHLRRELRREHREVEKEDYLAAQKFLISLNYEAEFMLALN